MLEERLLAILACPKCKGELKYRTEPEEVLICSNCMLLYEVIDNIPIMLLEKARPLKEE